MQHVAAFAELEPYTQDSGDQIDYQFVVKPGTMGLLSAGRVQVTGPTTKALDTHQGWDQIYLILDGEGTVLVGDTPHRVGPGMVVRIPEGTPHAVRCEAGERLEYVYVNAFTGPEALAGLMREAGL